MEKSNVQYMVIEEAIPLMDVKVEVIETLPSN
jgi:hypothetical protein